MKDQQVDIKNIIRIPLVSVIMPVYNSAKFLGESIRSVLRETYTNFEFLIYDDNSSDNSLSIIRDFSNKDRRIKVFKGDIKQKNVSTIYKFIADKSKGKYFIPTDSDDICLPHRVETLINIACQHSSASLVFGKTRIINEDGTKTIGYNGSEVSPYKLFLGNFVPDGASLISKDHYLICGGYNENIEWAEDYELRLRLLEQGPFIYVDKEVYLYRQHNNSWTSKKRDAGKEKIFKYKIAKRNIGIVKNISSKKDKKCRPYNYREYVAIKYAAAFYLSKYNFLKAYKSLSLLCPSKLPLISLFWLFIDRIGPVNIDKTIITKETIKNKLLELGLGCYRYPLASLIWLFIVRTGLIKLLSQSLLYKIDHKTENDMITDKTIVTKEAIRNKLLELGLKNEQKIIVHSSLSSFGFVVGGPETIIDVLKEIIGENGLIMMPAFTYYTGKRYFLRKYFSMDSICSKDMGTVAETFRKSGGVYRNFHPFTSFSFWGQNAQLCAEKYCLADSFTLKSPLGEILKGNGYVLMLGTDFSVLSVLHTAEYLSEVPYSAYKSVFNYIDNGIKKTIELRRTGHSGEFNKIAPYLDVKNKITIGNAQCCLLDAQQVVRKAKEILLKKPDFFLCSDKRCKTCRERRKMCRYG